MGGVLEHSPECPLLAPRSPGCSGGLTRVPTLARWSRHSVWVFLSQIVFRELWDPPGKCEGKPDRGDVSITGEEWLGLREHCPPQRRPCSELLSPEHQGVQPKQSGGFGPRGRVGLKTRQGCPQSRPSLGSCRLGCHPAQEVMWSGLLHDESILLAHGPATFE